MRVKHCVLFRHRLPTHCQAGFTLIELLITAVIVGILAMVALPAFQAQVAKGRRADAIAALSAVLQAQERARSNSSSYAATLAALQISSAAPKHYSLGLLGLGQPLSFVAGFEVQARPLSASPQRYDLPCQVMSIRVEGGNVRYLASNSAGADSSAQCWPQ